MARGLGLGVCAWASLGAGLLTGKYTQKQGKGRLSQPDWEISEKSRKSAEQLDTVARSIGHTPAQVALDWVRQQEAVVIPIIGATKPSQMKENIECLDFRLTGDQMKQLDEIGKIDLGFPHEFLRSDQARKLIFGDIFPLIDHR